MKWEREREKEWERKVAREHLLVNTCVTLCLKYIDPGTPSVPRSALKNLFLFCLETQQPARPFANCLGLLQIIPSRSVCCSLLSESSMDEVAELTGEQRPVHIATRRRHTYVLVAALAAALIASRVGLFGDAYLRRPRRDQRWVVKDYFRRRSDLRRHVFTPA